MSNIPVARAFIAAWEARDVDAIMAALMPDAVYHNIPMAPLTGHDAIRPVIAGFLAPATAVRWTVHQIAETAAGAVLTERTDAFEMGARTITIPVMGCMEFSGGRISQWRDYFDMAEFERQMAG